MTQLICPNCKSTFSTKYNLVKHIKTARYCLNKSSEYCEYCNMYFSKEEMSNHINICIEYLKSKIIKLEDVNMNNLKLIQDLEKYKIIINNYELQFTELKKLNKDLIDTLQKERIIYQDKINEITFKLIDKSNNITNNFNNSHTKIDVFNNLKPLTDYDFINNINNLTLDHVKNGAEGYAKYSLEYPLKDKLLCLDYSRKKICYKDENGNKIEEYKLNGLLKRLFENIDKKNYELINQII